MMTKKLFGTDGIRGVANSYPMTSEIAFRVGRATAYILKGKSDRTRIVIGKDTRLSGYMLESALTSGICSMGGNVLLTGPIPTTAVAYLTQKLAYDAGVVISASHNPSEDNGIKIFNKEGRKLSDDLEIEIERHVLENDIDAIRPIGSDIGKAFRLTDARTQYIDFLVSTFPPNYSLNNYKIILDCANGAAYKTAPEVFRKLGATVIPINYRPDGSNINDRCGALHPEDLSRTVVENGASFGVAFDGDADRAILCDETGKIIDGDYILAICGKHYCVNNQLENSSVVTTVMSNIGLELALQNFGVSLLRTDVGDRYVSEMLKKSGAILGGEQSGHIIFPQYFPAGDGILTALRVLEIMVSTSQPLSKLASIMVKYPQVLINVPVSEKKELSHIPAIQESINKVVEALDNEGRVLVRFSGTRPLVRIMVEGKEEKKIQYYATQIANSVRGELGVSV